MLLYQDCVVLPPSLGCRVLQNLHAAHQGTSTMEQRAHAIVYWPGMSQGIRETREGCTNCNRNIPSQAASTPLASSKGSKGGSSLHTHIPHKRVHASTNTRPLHPQYPVPRRKSLPAESAEPNPTKWDRSGVMVESARHDQYRVKVDGSGRITLNRLFLRA